MKMRYDPEVDILMIDLSKKSIDHAEQMDNIIVHFSPKNEPVLLEIMDASRFLAQSFETTAQGFQKSLKSKNRAL